MTHDTPQDDGQPRHGPAEIAADPTLTTARKIELITSYKEHHAGPHDDEAREAADREIARLLQQASR